MRRLVFRMLAPCGFLLPWLYVLRLLVLLLLCRLSLLRLSHLLLVVRVLVFIVIIVVGMDMWRPFATGRIQARRSSRGTGDSCSGGSERSSAGSVRQELLMLLRRLATSTSSGVVGFVTQPSALTGSAIASQSSPSGPHSVPSLGTYPWYFDFGASFHMTPHSAHLFPLHPSYRHCIVHTDDGSPLSVARQGTLSSDSFYVPNVSIGSPLSVAGQGTLSSDSFYVPNISLVPDLTMQLMSAGQIADHDCHVILDPDVCHIQDHRTGHLADTGPCWRDSQHL
jgi:hypothetical protein